MPEALQFWADHLPLALLVLVRVGSLVLVAPILGPFVVPLRTRAMVALALTVLVVPLEVDRTSWQTESLASFLVAACGEALGGLMLGLGVRILFAGLHVAGQVISQMSGLQLADVFSPGFGTSVPLFTQLLFLVTTAVFLLVGGHRQVIEALLDTFAWLPPGLAAGSPSAVTAVTELVAQSFALGLRAAAPAMVALLLATLIVGFVSRTLPQLNIMSLGFGINALVALAAVGVSLGGAAWLFQEQLEPALQTALQAIRPS